MPEKKFILSANDGSFFETGDSAGVYFERILEHPVDRVWTALTEPKHLAHWLAPAVIDGRKGGTITLQLTGGVMGGKITEWKSDGAEIGRARKPDGATKTEWRTRSGGKRSDGSGASGPTGVLLEYAWYNGSTVRWELLSEGKNRTRLLFTHRHVPGRQLVDAAKGWHYHLDLLGLELDGQEMPHNPVAQWDEITREATLRYNAAVAALRPEPEPLVLERVFDAPVERVWQALTNKEELKHWSFDIPDFEPEEGYEFTFNGQNENGIKTHYCRITEVIEQRKLAYSWRYRNIQGVSLVTWELFREGNKTRLRLTHTGLEKLAHAGAGFRRQGFITGWSSIFELLGTWLQRMPVGAAQ